VTDSIFLHIKEQQHESKDDATCRNYETANGCQGNRVEYAFFRDGLDRLDRDCIDSPNAKTENSGKRIRKRESNQRLCVVRCVFDIISEDVERSVEFTAVVRSVLDGCTSACSERDCVSCGVSDNCVSIQQSLTAHVKFVFSELEASDCDLVRLLEDCRVTGSVV
jgi:hypothetical protein